MGSWNLFHWHSILALWYDPFCWWKEFQSYPWKESRWSFIFYQGLIRDVFEVEEVHEVFVGLKIKSFAGIKILLSLESPGSKTKTNLFLNILISIVFSSFFATESALLWIDLLLNKLDRGICSIDILLWHCGTIHFVGEKNFRVILKMRVGGL